jgi:hypothetical protein
MSPLFFSLCLIVLQIVSMGLRSGDSRGFNSHLMPNCLFACLHSLSLTLHVLWLLSLSSRRRVRQGVSIIVLDARGDVGLKLTAGSGCWQYFRSV